MHWIVDGSGMPGCDACNANHTVSDGRFLYKKG